MMFHTSNQSEYLNDAAGRLGLLRAVSGNERAVGEINGA